MKSAWRFVPYVCTCCGMVVKLYTRVAPERARRPCGVAGRVVTLRRADMKTEGRS